MSFCCLLISVQPCKHQQKLFAVQEEGLNVAVTRQPPAGKLPNQPCKSKQIRLLCKEKAWNVAVTRQPPASMVPNKTDIPVHKQRAVFAMLTHKSRLRCRLHCSMDPRNHHCPCRTYPWGSRSLDCLVHQTVNDRYITLLCITLQSGSACSKVQSDRLLSYPVKCSNSAPAFRRQVAAITVVHSLRCSRTQS